MASFWDSPLVTSVAFHPRPHAKNTALPPNAIDGTFSSPACSLGYRFFRPAQPDNYKCVVLVFHANAEIAADYASAAAEFASMNPPAALLAVDYRGFGWSSGEPSLTGLLDDAEFVVTHLDTVAELNPRVPVVVYGRSIGSQCAIHVATKFPQRIHGLVVDSGFHSILKLPMVNQLAMMLPGGAGMLQMLPNIFNTLDKMKKITDTPVLVIHGTDDEIAPLAQGRELHAACGAAKKTLREFPNAGHNDIPVRHRSAYFGALESFLKDALARATALSVVTNLAAAYAKKQYDLVVEGGKEALQSDRLALADQILVLELVAKASWHQGDASAVVKYTTRLLNRQPEHINALCLRAKAFVQMDDVDLMKDDAMTLSELLAGGETSTEASVAMALLMIQCWNVD
ncbi:Aste57867_25207 [Aphanomyces stellatus]|uniref:Aste57867_25207 protein n=1 Tax=Aphanomyces stellatus TaxID=120398 RepID=A0A485LSH6_9STRA|nr:hypothetical protein As57867_025129 [Aphanomyces stellatus]VFU01834.1 Aste57867_25207 [Aphanomyces stellatus]